MHGARGDEDQSGGGAAKVYRAVGGGVGRKSKSRVKATSGKGHHPHHHPYTSHTTMADPETQPQPEEQPKAPVKEKEVLGKTLRPEK